MSKLHFIATIQIIGVNPYVLVSSEQASKVKPNWKKPIPVLVQVNGKPNPPWHINMVPKGNGNFYLYLHGDVRKASQTKVGDIVTIAVAFDKSYKNGPAKPPKWFTNALDQNITAKENFTKLSPSRQKEIVRYLLNVKSQEAKDRNLKRALGVLNGNEERFMGRLWKDGV